MVELQEPTDLSVLLEWDGFELTEDDGPPRPRLGPRACEALDLGGWSRGPRAEHCAVPRCPPTPTRTSASSGCVAAPCSTPASRSSLRSTAAVRSPPTLRELELARGAAVLVPHAAGTGELRGDLDVLRARPADPAAGDGRW